MSLLEGGRDGLANVGPPARPFECLRVSGPTPRDGFRPPRAGMKGEKGTEMDSRLGASSVGGRFAYSRIEGLE